MEIKRKRSGRTTGLPPSRTSTSNKQQFLTEAEEEWDKKQVEAGKFGSQKEWKLCIRGILGYSCSAKCHLCMPRLSYCNILSDQQGRDNNGKSISWWLWSITGLLEID